MCSNSWLLSLIVLLPATSTTSAQEKRTALAGWFDAFPVVKRVSHRQFQPPKVGKNKDGKAVYSQTLHYDAVTGLIREFDFTLTRDPMTKERYDPKVLRGLPEPPKEFKAGKYQGWAWSDDKFVIVFGEDKAAIISKSPGSVINFPIEEADPGLWDKLARILEHPPRTDFTLTLATFKSVPRGATVLALEEWCGHAAEVKAAADDKKLSLRIYPLVDGSRVIVGARERVEFIRHEGKDGRVEELSK